MVQQHLVYHYTSYEEGVTYYEPNLQSAYYLIRAGKILEFIEERLGKYAATVMSTIMFLGHAQVSYLETLPELQPQAPTAVNGNHEQPEKEIEGEGVEGEGIEEEGHTNGVNGEEALEEQEEQAQPFLLHPTLKALAAHGYIHRVREAHFQSYADNVLDCERTIKARADIKQMKGKKLEETVLELTAEMLRERLDGDLTHGLVFNGVPRGAKRRRGPGGAERSNKKARVDYVAVDEDEEEEEENEWSEDEMGGDNIPMEVNGSTSSSRLPDSPFYQTEWNHRPSQLRKARRRAPQPSISRARRAGLFRCHDSRLRMSPATHRIQNQTVPGYPRNPPRRRRRQAVRCPD
jgi:DNA-directed RNA polymerase III subunit RPC3